MANINCNILNAIIGISGTLIGVILGAILNQISRLGKLNIYPTMFQIHISKRDKSGGFEAQKAIDEDTSNVSIEFDLDLYNSSSEQKIGRDTYLVIKKGKKEIKEIIKDKSTTTYTDYSSRTDQLSNFNIPPKSIYSLKLVTYINKEKYHWLNNAIVIFEFKNNRNRIKRIQVTTLN